MIPIKDNKHLFRDENNIYSPIKERTKKGKSIKVPKRKREKLFNNLPSMIS